MRRLSLSFIALFLILTEFAMAAPFRRLVNFEWDAIEGATAYDVELMPNKDAAPEQQPEVKKFSFSSKEPSWNGKIAPGKYLMRLRSRDYRGVPGEWSPPSEFDVGLDVVVLKSPAKNLNIKSEEDGEQKVNFAWQPVGGAVNYSFEIVSEDGSFSKSGQLTETKTEVVLPVAKKYTWKVIAINKDNIGSEAASVGEFSLMGRTLAEPKIVKPLTKFVREVTWSKIDKSEAYDAYVLKLNTQNRKWEKFQSFENYKGETLPFDASWTGGKYQLAVRAKANLRGSSKLTKQIFEVAHGDRSPASEYTALVRTSIDRITGWFGIASYLVTEISYSGTNPEKNSFVSYKAKGGTGRIGLGWMSTESIWGFLAIADLSGFIFNGKTSTYASAEFNGIYRQYVSNRSELRVQAGAYYKEIPETIGETTATSQNSIDTKITAAGPHLGAEYWYSLTPKLGVQANMHFYYSAMKIQTPNGQPITPTLSTQIGFLGSYRFTPTLTGLAGYARREERMSYKCGVNEYDGGCDNNKSTITGDYLNLFAEWSF